MKLKKHLFWQIPFLLFLVIGTIIIIRQQRSIPYQHDEGFIFGTVYHITYQSDRNYQKEYIENVGELNSINDEFSMFDKNSTVSRINTNNPSVNISDRFLSVYLLAQEVNQETDGAFDITVAPLVNAWGFGFKSQRLPGKKQVDSLLQFVGMDKFRITPDRSYEKSDPRVMLDFSAIAKGYGTDVVAQFLKTKGIKNFMIEIGGEVVASGISEKKTPWRIGITKPADDPNNTNTQLQAILNVTDMALATSGNYRNFYYKGGRKYAHTIDPRTGYPVQHSILSATVLADQCAKADAYATSFMVLGFEKAKKVLKKHPELMAYIIYSDAKGNKAVWHSPSLKEKIMK
ncbi:MAG: FAD:protein FMN transferase [Prevotella sp.]